jgi:uncharacterized membrane protein
LVGQRATLTSNAGSPDAVRGASRRHQQPWFDILAVAISFAAMAALIAVAVLMIRER